MLCTLQQFLITVCIYFLLSISTVALKATVFTPIEMHYLLLLHVNHLGISTICTLSTFECFLQLCNDLKGAVDFVPLYKHIQKTTRLRQKLPLCIGFLYLESCFETLG